MACASKTAHKARWAKRTAAPGAAAENSAGLMARLRARRSSSSTSQIMSSSASEMSSTPTTSPSTTCTATTITVRMRRRQRQAWIGCKEAHGGDVFDGRDEIIHRADDISRQQQRPRHRGHQVLRILPRELHQHIVELPRPAGMRERLHVGQSGTALRRLVNGEAWDGHDELGGERAGLDVDRCEVDVLRTTKPPDQNSKLRHNITQTQDHGLNTVDHGW